MPTMEEMMEVFDVTITVFVGDKPIYKSQMSAPRIAIEAEFKALVQQVANQKQPMRVLMERYEVGWDPFDKKSIILPYTMEFTNYTPAETAPQG